jgi:16S rRNA (cytosine967-C5)-methyltransferase
MSVSPSRATAFDILLRVEQEDAYASELLHSSRCAELSLPDRALATELVMGVLRWRSALDASIARVSSQPLHKLDIEVLTALRLGAYQLGWLDRIPKRAAIYESVELVKKVRKRSAAPFANAVLRKLADTTEFARESLPAATDPDEIATASSHPSWLVHRWASHYGMETARRICAYDQSIPVTTIRLRSPAAEQELQAEGIELAPGNFLVSARRVISGDVTKTKAYNAGQVAIQDEASQLVAALVGRGSRILDCCAAPGGKTWAIADRNPAATIVAVELHAHRAQLLRKRVLAGNVEVIHADIRDLPLNTPFDRVLVDAPCSGTGTIARNPEIKWRLKPEDLVTLHALQTAILEASMKQVAPGGTLIYSTCSLEPEENENVVGAAIRSLPSFRVQDVRSHLESLLTKDFLRVGDVASFVHRSYLRTIPGVHACDGFFIAILERAGEASLR